MRRLAIVADIHGNLPALEAVLADMARRQVDGVVNLGDCVSGPLWPAETAARLRGLGWATVRGNHDRLAGADMGAGLGRSDRFAWERLSPDDRAWLRALPPLLRLEGGVVALHACPDDDERYLLENQEGAVLRRAPAATVASRLGALEAAIVLTAHSHRAASLRLPDGRWVLNPGSVGCPAYDDDATTPPHVSEAGCPSARYAVLAFTSDAPMIEALSIPYPHEEAALQAEANGRPEWAHALRTGFASQPAR